MYFDFVIRIIGLRLLLFYCENIYSLLWTLGTLQYPMSACPSAWYNILLGAPLYSVQDATPRTTHATTLSIRSLLPSTRGVNHPRQG